MALPKVVIVGRPNVGKSSLFNWLAGRRIAIVDDMAGVTRDRVGTLVQLGDDVEPRFVELMDTGGIGMVDRDDLSEDVERQIDTAMNEADLILFVVDIRDGVMPLDEEVAQRLRYLKTPVILVMNKADHPDFDNRGAEFYKLGRGKPIAVSAQQNRNKKPLLQCIEEMLPPADAAPPADAVMKIAAVGRPNTGKLTLINTLAQAERMIVSERPGTTRDSVDVRFELDGLPFIAIDTAGVKRKAKIRESLDFYSVHRAERSIRRADVVLLFLDPTQGISRLDKQLADYIAQQHKPCIFAVNKWDLMVSDPDDPSQGNMGRFANLIQHAFRTMSYMPIAFITAKTGKNVKAAAEPGPVAVQAVAAARRAPARSTACCARRSTPIRRPRARTGRRGSTTPPRWTSPRRRSCCSSTAPSSSTRPISVTCSTSSGRSSRSATSRSSSTSAPASRSSRAAAPPAAGRRRPTRSNSPWIRGRIRAVEPRARLRAERPIDEVPPPRGQRTPGRPGRLNRVAAPPDRQTPRSPRA